MAPEGSNVSGGLFFYRPRVRDCSGNPFCFHDLPWQKDCSEKPDPSFRGVAGEGHAQKIKLHPFDLFNIKIVMISLLILKI